MKKLLLTAFLLMACQLMFSQEWKNLKSPINISFANSNVRFAQDKIPQVPQQNHWEVTAWKGEKVHAQVLVWTNKDIVELNVKVSDLVNEKNGRIRADNISTGILRYVMTDEFGRGCGARMPSDFDSSRVADVIDTISSTAITKNNVQPYWLSIKVPSSAASGQYTGTLTFNSGKQHKLQLALKVVDRVLPAPSEWSFDLDLWQHPAAIARVHNVALWSKEHYELMRPYYKMLAAAGQKNITTSIIHEPWNHQTFDDFGSLVKWIKRKDGSWKYDYSLFDQYVSFVMSCGIKKRINCYTMVPWKLSFQYFDEKSGKDTVFTAKTTSEEYRDFWTKMLKDFSRHLKQKGWFNMTAIAMDERPMEDMQAVIKILKDVDPAWKITLAGIYHPEIEKDIFEYSIASKWLFGDDVLKRRIAEGKPSTYYTSCEEAYPNGFTFSPPAEHVWIGWYAAAKGFTGYLRWAYNSWVEKPLEDSRFRTWPAGDTYQIYPGPLTSVRFEKLIEGVQDFEKIRILKEEFKKTGDQARQNKLNTALTAFEIQHLSTKRAADMVEKAKSVLNEL